MSNSQRRRRNIRRDQRRLQEHLRKRCYICYTTTEEFSVAVPCCKKQIHESCLIKAFDHSYLPDDYRCPFCRQQLNPYNVDEPFFPERTGPNDPIPMGFRYRTFIHNFLPGRQDAHQQPHVPPPGWADFMREMARRHPSPPKPDNVIYRPG